MKINLNTLLIIGAIVLVILYFGQCSRIVKLKEDIKIGEQNNTALSDSISSYKAKNGDLVYEKAILIASEKDLKKLNKELYDDIKYLKDHPKIVIKEVIKVEVDTFIVETNIIDYGDGKYGFEWDHDTTFSKGNFQQLSGRTLFYLDTNGVHNPITYIDTDKLGISFTTGLTKKKDSYEIFIKSNFPGFQPASIEGSVIDKKMITGNESSFVFGPTLGYGLMLSNGNVSYGPIVGFSVTYNLNKKIKKIFHPLGN